MTDSESNNAADEPENSTPTVTGPPTESRIRSMLKAFSWRIVATTTTTTIAWLTTGQVRTALTIGGIEFFAKVPVYYFHERAWQMVPRGAIRGLFGAPKSGN